MAMACTHQGRCILVAMACMMQAGYEVERREASLREWRGRSSWTALQHDVEGILRERLAEAQTEYVRLHDLWTALRS